MNRRAVLIILFTAVFSMAKSIKNSCPSKIKQNQCLTHLWYGYVVISTRAHGIVVKYNFLIFVPPTTTRLRRSRFSIQCLMKIIFYLTLFSAYFFESQFSRCLLIKLRVVKIVKAILCVLLLQSK